MKIFWFISLFAVVVAGALLLAGQLGVLKGHAPGDLGVQNGRLKPPSWTPNSVSSQADLYPDHPQKDYARIAPIQFTGDDAVDTPLGNFQRHEPFSVSLWIQTPDVKDRAVVFHRSQAWTDAASRGYELLIEEGKLKWSLIHFWPGNAISIRTKQNLPLKQWVHVVVTNDGSSRAGNTDVVRSPFLVFPIPLVLC